MEENLKTDIEKIQLSELEQIEGGALEETQSSAKCGACCKLLGGGGSASKELGSEIDQL